MLSLVRKSDPARRLRNLSFSRHRDCVIGEALLAGAKKGRRLNNVLSYQINSTKFQKKNFLTSEQNFKNFPKFRKLKFVEVTKIYILNLLAIGSSKFRVEKGQMVIQFLTEKQFTLQNRAISWKSTDPIIFLHGEINSQDI